MNPNDLLLIAKKMGLPDVHIEDGIVYVEVSTERWGACYGEFSPHTCLNDLLRVMCHFRIWIDDKPDRSQFAAYHYSGQHKTEVLRDGPATPEGIVSAVLELALKLSEG